MNAPHVLFMSGYDQEALKRSDVPYLQKPFGREELARTVRMLLDDHAPLSAA
jgi:two-component SAPR family response regulator